MNTYGDQTKELDDLRDVVRETGKGNGWDPSCERAPSWGEGTLAGQVINRLWSALYQAARSIGQLVESNERLERRNGQLASSNGALMVDRTRGIEDANERAQEAYMWASQVAREAGVSAEEWPERARDLLNAQQATQARLERQVARLEHLRATVLVPLIAACERSSEGFTGDQVKLLKRKLNRENDRAMGR